MSRNSAKFNSEDRNQLKEICNTLKELVDEIRGLKTELEQCRNELDQVKIENAKLKQATNLNIFKLDELEQYGRRENLRIYGIPENSGENDDGESVLMSLADTLSISLTKNDVQRVHRLGQKRNKPRPIIARFVNYQKRNEFFLAKSKLKETSNFKRAFITEDLTLLRSKLFHYVKNECQGKFVMCHTWNGKIRMKKSKKKAGLYLDPEEKDVGIGNWLVIASPDDLFQYDVDIDLKKLGFQPLFINNSDCSR